MGEILGIGVSHYPPFSGTDNDMANIVRHRLKDPDLPPHWQDKSQWPQAMQDEWGDDEGLASAAVHRASMLKGMRHCMDEIRAFNPDFCIIWGDDQYENFKEDIIPPFCVLAYDDMQVKPWAHAQESADMSGKPNIWGETADTSFDVKFPKAAAKHLVSELLKAEFDVSYAYKPNNHPGIAHAFLNAILYLDYDRKGFPYPVIPFPINCYGERVISYRGFISALGDKRELDPPSPSPKRCFNLGAEVARICKESPYRVALIASSSWSHAFLCDHTSRMMPDVEFDKKMYAALKSNKYDVWRDTPLEAVTHSGNQEMLNWMTLLGAMDAIGAKTEWSEFVETHVFNSNKVAAVFKT